MGTKTLQQLATRRGFMANAGKVGLVGLSVGMIQSCGTMERLLGVAPPEDTSLEDAEKLNPVLEVEYKLVAAYENVLNFGVLNQSGIELARNFRDDHRRHATAMKTLIKSLEVNPETAKDKYDFDPEKVKTMKDALMFFRDMEHEILMQYFAAIPQVKDRKTAQTPVSILGVESMHWSVLRYWLGERPVPDAILG